MKLTIRSQFFPCTTDFISSNLVSVETYLEAKVEMVSDRTKAKAIKAAGSEGRGDVDSH
jgi:hypothetical protein